MITSKLLQINKQLNGKLIFNHNIDKMSPDFIKAFDHIQTESGYLRVYLDELLGNIQATLHLVENTESKFTVNFEGFKDHLITLNHIFETTKIKLEKDISILGDHKLLENIELYREQKKSDPEEFFKEETDILLMIGNIELLLDQIFSNNLFKYWITLPVPADDINNLTIVDTLYQTLKGTNNEDFYNYLCISTEYVSYIIETALLSKALSSLKNVLSKEKNQILNVHFIK